jgi:iron complex outermembrane receptor protein
LSFDPVALLNEGNVFNLRPLENSDVIVKAWTVEERVTTLYGQVNIDTMFGPVPLTGNAGLQIVKTEQESSGGVLDPVSQNAVIVSDGDDYTTLLPSLNLSWEVAENQYLRLGMARTLARARMDDMRASFAVNYDLAGEPITNPQNSYWNGSGGNPRLRPWIANSIDLSYENYFGGAGYLAVAAFYKDLDTYIYNQDVVFDFTGYPLLNATDNPATNLGIASTPQNASGGYLQGVELTISLPGETLTDALEGFGVLINASSTDSNIRPPNTPGSALPGLSETVINSTIYFERAGFEARISNRYRTDFLGEVTGFGAGRELRLVKGESVFDAQVGYRFGDGPLDGLSILLQGNNLTDEPFGTFESGDERRVRDHQVYGRTFLLGVSYRR